MLDVDLEWIDDIVLSRNRFRQLDLNPHHKVLFDRVRGNISSVYNKNSVCGRKRLYKRMIWTASTSIVNHVGAKILIVER